MEYTHQTTYGALKVKDLIGKEYGTKIQLSKGYAYVLQTNPELWSNNLPHRTQILYTPDTSMILFQLEVKPGSVVIEAGTGSGSLSHYFLRALKDEGHLYTFDFHENRADQAREEFKEHGLEKFVTVQHRDVCAEGFTDELNNKADALFLDLPEPHKAIKHVVKALKSKGSRFCAFSPCIEQVQATCLQLQDYGFVEIQTTEILQSEHIVKYRDVPILDLTFVKTKKNEENDEDNNGDESAPPEKKKRTEKRPQLPTKRVLTTNTPMTQPGHTGYLTFATFMNFEK
jgi:tRNA (adenine57-N1/adenine58-N1)-methyltransferase